MELKGKNAIVTGAARGIGRGIALKLAEAGANVAAVDLGNPRDPALTYSLAAHGDLASAVDELQARGVKAVPILADVTRLGDCERMVAETVKALGSLEVLVNNAGIIAAGPVAEFSEAAWDRVMAVNAKGPFLCAKAAIPHLLRNPQGAIVNIASIAGKTARGGLSAYCASKFAVMALTQALAEELGPSNIRVNAVCPGLLRTAMWTDVLDQYLSRAWGGNAESLFDDTVGSMCYLRREQPPADIGEAVVYLARADNVTGTSLVVAGGAEIH
jgi:meso-butanediol dehydrogenase/(S,S)-butanediol dehydrogenase/diacetyl reductase